MNPIFFTSNRNYMKRDPSSGSGTMATPTTSAYSGYIYTTTKVITHNLGFIPVFRVQYEPFADGIIWPAMGTRITQGAINPSNTAATGPGLICWPSATSLTLQLFYKNNTLPGSFPVYWVIYQDFPL